jgi:hypothetical protein
MSGSGANVGTRQPGGNLASIRFYRVALTLSLVLNALMLAAFWLYVHFAGTLSLIEDAVGFFN